MDESTRPDIEFSPRADRDLEDTVDFLLGRSRSAAERFADAFDQTIARLLVFPESGVQRSGGRRLAPVSDTGYLISYSYRRNRLLILRVKHGARR